MKHTYRSTWKIYFDQMPKGRKRPKGLRRPSPCGPGTAIQAVEVRPETRSFMRHAARRDRRDAYPAYLSGGFRRNFYPVAHVPYVLFVPYVLSPRRNFPAPGPSPNRHRPRQIHPPTSHDPHQITPRIYRKNLRFVPLSMYNLASRSGSIRKRFKPDPCLLQVTSAAAGTPAHTPNRGFPIVPTGRFR